jgi:VCBS repeat-containing protein
VLSNDKNGPLTAALATGPAHGNLQLNSDGSLQYQSQQNYNGTDQFTYRANNAAGTAMATVTITITALNDPPVFTKGPNQSVSQGASQQTVPNWATGIMIGANNPFHDQTLNFVVTTDHPELFVQAPAISPDGTLTYQPAAGVTGTATVTVVLHDSGGTANGGSDTSAPQTFTITVVP